MALPLPHLLLVAAAVTGHAEGELVTTEHDLSPPLVVTVTGPASVAPNRTIELVVHVERAFPDDVPLALEVHVPAGAALESAVPSRIVAGTARRLARTLRLSTTRVPDGDVVVTVRALTSTHGAVATARYSFGRALAPVGTPVFGDELEGPGGVRLGRPVMLSSARAPGLDAVGRPRVAPRAVAGRERLSTRDTTPPLYSRVNWVAEDISQ